MKLDDPSIMWSCDVRSHDKLNTLCSHLHQANDQQTWEGGDLLGASSTHKSR